MGIPSALPTTSGPHNSEQTTTRTHKAFIVTNYLLLGAASGAAFLTLSLRLVPSPSGFLLLLLQALTASASLLGISGRAHGAHVVLTVLAAIFQGAVSVLAFTRTYEFLAGGLRSYVQADDGVVILRMVGGLCLAIFALEWVALVLGFVVRYDDDDHEDGKGGTARVRCDGDEMKDWPWPFQV